VGGIFAGAADAGSVGPDHHAITPSVGDSASMPALNGGGAHRGYVHRHQAIRAPAARVACGGAWLHAHSSPGAAWRRERARVGPQGPQGARRDTGIRGAGALRQHRPAAHALQSGGDRCGHLLPDRADTRCPPPAPAALQPPAAGGRRGAGARHGGR
jgi:hypothetical protein